MLTAQLEIPTAQPPDRRTAGLPVLDQRQRGTSFHEVPVKAILNSPATTGMGFWSLNPYVGCEFGCTYCYARETHKWVMEKTAGRPDGQQYDRRTVGEEEHEATAVSLAATDSPAALPSPGSPSRSGSWSRPPPPPSSSAPCSRRSSTAAP